MGEGAARAAGPFTVLYVCTGNRCRSPLAERFLRHELDRRYGQEARRLWRVESAGVKAVMGGDMDLSARKVLEKRGVDGTGFVTRPLTVDLIGRADLVLTAERQHRSDVVTVVPAAVGYTFTMRQFARLAASAPASSLSGAGRPGEQLLALAVNQRGVVAPASGPDEDVPDPIGKPMRTFRKCADLLQQTVSDTLAPIGARARS